MAWGDHELARATPAGLEIRATSTRLSWDLADLPTSDGHDLVVAFSVTANVLESAVEQKMLREVFLQGPTSLTRRDVIAHFTSALRDVASTRVREQPASFWLDAQNSPALREALLASAKAVAFSCGLEIVPPVSIVVTSPSVERAQREARARQTTADRMADQSLVMKKSIELLHQFNDAKEANPSLTVSQLLNQLPANDGASTLQALLLATGSDATERTLYAVAGPNLVRIDARATPPAVTCISLTRDLGPLRSVQASNVEGRSMALIGARSGILMLDPQFDPPSPTLFRDDVIDTQRGFSQAAVCDGLLWACHGDAGVVAWAISTPDHPRITLRPQTMLDGITLVDPRHFICLSDGRVALGAGSDVFILDGDGQAVRHFSYSAAVVGLIDDAPTFWTILGDGRAIRQDHHTLDVISDDRRFAPPTVVGRLPFLGTQRLLSGDTSGRIQCQGTDDPLLMQMNSPFGEVRMLAATNDLIATTSADRQRVGWWRPWDTHKLAGEVNVTQIARHRVADIDFI